MYYNNSFSFFWGSSLQSSFKMICRIRKPVWIGNECELFVVNFVLIVFLFVISRAAEKGNFEAAVKLGIAYLYNEGRKFWHSSSLFLWCVSSLRLINDELSDSDELSCWLITVIWSVQRHFVKTVELICAAGGRPGSSAWPRVSGLPCRTLLSGSSSARRGPCQGAVVRPWCSTASKRNVTPTR